jgi:hypothetical protein
MLSNNFSSTFLFDCITPHFLGVSTGYCYDTVDIFNGKMKKWSTARLSIARYGLAATSLPSQGLALFAGGVGAIFVTFF